MTYRPQRTLLQRLASAGHGMALGWQPDMPGLMAAVAALVDNAGGQTCQEAFAAGVPVVTYRPMPDTAATVPAQPPGPA